MGRSPQRLLVSTERTGVILLNCLIVFMFLTRSDDRYVAQIPVTYHSIGEGWEWGGFTLNLYTGSLQGVTRSGGATVSQISVSPRVCRKRKYTRPCTVIHLPLEREFLPSVYDTGQKETPPFFSTPFRISLFGNIKNNFI